MRLPYKSAVESVPAPGGAEETGGWFSAGNPSNGTPATVPGPEWFNDVTGQLRGVMAAAEIEPPEPGAAYDFTLLADAIEALIAAALPSIPSTVADLAFMAGWDVDGTAADLVVQPYGYAVLARDTTFDGTFGYIEDAPTGAAVIVDVLADGVSIFSTKPEFAAAANAITAGVFTGGSGSITLVAGTRLRFEVTQIGSGTAGARMGFTLKGEGA